MRGKRCFTVSEIDAIRVILAQLRCANHPGQKKLRRTLREKYCFWITDFYNSNKGFDVADFNRLVACGDITVGVCTTPKTAPALESGRKLQDQTVRCAPMPVNESEMQHIFTRLSDSNRAEDPRTFPMDGSAASKPGLYSWWADETAWELFGQVRAERVPQPIYIGQAGYNTSATLNDRVKDSHIEGKKNGDVSRSTFRKTISALLLEPLNLCLEGSDKLSLDDNRRVSEWIKNHLRVTIVPWNNRNSLNSIEHAVLKKLDPPLNLRGRPETALRRLVRAQRKVIKLGNNILSHSILSSKLLDFE